MLSLFEIVKTGSQRYVRSLPSSILIVFIAILVGILITIPILHISPHGYDLSLDRTPYLGWLLLLPYLISLLTATVIYLKLNQPQASSVFSLVKQALSRLPKLIVASIFSAILLIVGYFFFVIPGIIFSVILPFYFALIITDDAGIWSGFRSACQLVWGRWWRSMAIVILPTVILSALAWGIELLLNSFLVLEGAGINTLPAVDLIYNTILTAIFVPFTIALISEQLHALKNDTERSTGRVDRILDYVGRAW